MTIAACGKASIDPGPAVIYSGTLVARDPATFNTARPSIHVKTPTDQSCGIIFSMTSQTPITIRKQNQVTPANTDALVVGAQVDVSHSGIVAESCPAQGGAYAVEVVQ
ncbi:MAG TPA: hypothetical protein VM100_10950 [Longimicrobiales bacterium]|nr:hypothetical protein [Longimicrobiales bacterium]